MNLSAKFAIIFSGIILLMGAVSFYGVYGFQKDILEKEITEKLENVASAHLDKLDRTFYERLSDLKILSVDPVVTSRNSTAEQIQNELNKFSKGYPHYVSVSFFNMDRLRLASSGSLKHVGQQHSLTEYWPAVYEGKDNIINISKSESLGIPTVHMVERVVDSNGVALGILVARVPVEGLYDLVDGDKNVNADKSKYKVDILDRDGLVLYSNHNKQAILNAIDDDFGIIKAVLPMTKNVGSLTHAHDPSGGQSQGGSGELLAFAKELGYQKFEGNGWILKIEYATNEAFAPITTLERRVSILLLAVSFVAIAMILSVLLFTVVRPLKKLSDATVRLGKGDLNAKVAIESRDEIGKLAKSFNEMALGLKEAREKLANAANVALERAGLAERRIISVSEETQQRIGQELHDDLGQQLTGIAFMSEVLCQRLRSQGHPDTTDASRITALINEAISKTRKLAHGLYPVEMKERGLRAMLEHLANNVESIYQTKCEFICEGECRVDDPIAAINLFRIAQEAVNNAIKHGRATKITLKMVSTPSMTTLEITDNGCGIGKVAELDAKKGIGMHTMQYRASLLGADLHILALPAGGVSVTLSLPA